MNKKRHFLTALIVVVMCVCLVVSFVACANNEKENNENTETNNELFTNGQFTLTTGENYPLTPSSWTSASGTSSAPSGSDNLIAGVIDTSEKSFKSNKKTYGNINNPGKVGANDDNVLMIYNKNATSYKYTSSGVKLNKNSYYKLTFAVKTLITSTTSNSGVYAYVNGDAYAAFEAVNTNGEWKTYTVYFQTSNIADNNINLVLSLGKESTYTSGHAFFDDVVLTNLTDVKEGETAFTQTDFDNVAINETTAKYSMIVGDKEFDYTSSSSSSVFNPVKYNGQQGSGSNGSAPSSSNYIDKGIVDTSVTKTTPLGDGTIDLTAAPNAVGSKVLMLNNKKDTAYGYRASSAIRFGASKYYALSIYVRTNILNGKGATLKLTNGTSTDERNITIDEINTNDAWQQVTFYVESNAKRHNDLYLEMWLGQGGKDDTNTHVKGIALFDSVSFKEITAEEYNGQSTNKFSLKSTTPEDPIDQSKFANTTYDDTIATDRSEFKVENGLLTINNILPTATTISNFTKNDDDKLVSTNGYTIYPNTYYLVSVMFKTEIADKNKGLNINLISENKDAKSDKYEDKKTTSASLTNLNSTNLEDNIISDGYTEAKFFVKGGHYDSKIVGLEFVLGTGKGTQSSAHVIGKVIIKSMSVEKITASEYNAVSSDTLTKTTSFEESAGENEIASNGQFKLIDSAATKELYKENIFTNEGKLDKHMAVPKGWTITNKSAITDGNSRSGVIDLNSTSLMTELGLVTDNFFEGFEGATLENNPTVLGINSIDSKAIGYSSNTVSLSANSYYVFSVWAKSNGSNITIELSTKSGNGKETKYHNITPVDSKWHRYYIYVETGIASVSLKLSLYAGNPQASSNTNNGWVFYDNAKYVSIDENTYKQGAKLESSTTTNVLAQSWLVDSFESTSQDGISNPSNWSGSLIDSEAKSDSENLTAGVFDRTTGDWSKLNIDPDKAPTVANAIFDDSKNIGDSVLAIYNKNAGAYKYSSTSTNLKADTYYKISVWVLTYGLAKDDSATVTLKLNNQTYTFGKLISDKSTAYDKNRLINTSTYAEDGTETIGTWKELNYYVKTDKDVTASATLSVGLGYSGKDNWKDGYVFADNFSVTAITEEEFIERKVVEGETEETIDESLIADELVPNNFRIVFTEESANAEEDLNADKEENTDDNKNKNDLLWLWITSGIVGGVIVIAVIVVMIRKFAPKKKNRKLTSKKSSKSNKSKNNKFSD